ncbi:hypothetical protein Poli38472_009454 [Pythium oligandrum]|uniref:LD-carboxypeptidase n=1 Tax=Pythium oligandrum TaxID=41045 RepID=A0A8K1CFM3_PYTOL|nr:hypothetical protein Poli38472_009454 [Pythium oligandrum]|eukprot:TMW61961.1 hypothetical protein Poli38472_009454 [Pythium oligandrum]
MAFCRPRALLPGATIAFVAPASGLAAFVPHRLEQAKLQLEQRGFVVKVFESVTKKPQDNVATLIEAHATSGKPLDTTLYDATKPCYGSADALTRAQDLMDAFRDPSVDAIVCTIGGFNSHEILEYLDFDFIRTHPKVFMGFSDITSVHLALQSQARMISFYGTSVITGFGEFPAPLTYTMDYFHKAVATADPIGEVMPSAEWTDDKTANWFTKADITYQEVMQPNTGFKWLRPGQARGPILGGCLPVLLNVRGSKYMPDLQDAILLLEAPEGHQFDQGMALQDINMVLGALRIDGTFHKIKGLVMGRVFKHKSEDVDEILRLVLYHTRDTSFPILYGVDIGHTNPVMTIPLGAQVSLDSSTDRFVIEEAGVEVP